MYFQATEYVLWSLSYTVWIRLEFLLIYNQAGPSKKEIIAKRSNFQRKIWTNLEKHSETKSQNNQLPGRPIAPNSENFVGVKRPLGELRKFFGPLSPP